MKLTTKHLQLDPATDVRLAWVTYALRHQMRLTPAATRATTIIKRAIDLYTVHLDGLLWPAPDRYDDPRMPELMRLGEMARLRECAHVRSLGVPLEAVEVVPVRPLAAIIKDLSRGQPNGPLLVPTITEDDDDEPDYD